MSACKEHAHAFREPGDEMEPVLAAAVIEDMSGQHALDRGAVARERQAQALG
jgi:hypothetical protein